jgi:hypothetical protein
VLGAIIERVSGVCYEDDIDTLVPREKQQILAPSSEVVF